MMAIVMKGETIDLVTCPNQEEFFEEWASWFNNKEVVDNTSGHISTHRGWAKKILWRHGRR